MNNDFARDDSIVQPIGDLTNGIRRISVCLVETSVPGAKGSMPRYADLIEQAFDGDPEITIHRASLARPPGFVRRLPSSLRTLAHHASVFFSAIKLNRRSDFDLFHVIDGSHGYVVPRLISRPTMVTVHDVIPALQATGRFETACPGRAARWVIQSALRGVDRATAIVCDSHSSRDDLISFNASLSTKSHIIHPPLEPAFTTFDSHTKEVFERTGKHGVDKNDQSSSELVSDTVNCPAGVSRQFLLHIGNNAFYKNRGGVLNVFAKMADRVTHRLIMAGPPPSETLIELANQLGIRQRIDFVVDPTDQQVRQLYHDASLLLFPSVYEGFGWPPLEAMASGCPVVCSNAGSLAEVVGDAAFAFAWGDVDSMADAAINVLNDPVLAAQMKSKGLCHAKKFTVEKFRRELRKCWMDVATQPTHPRGSRAKAR